MLFFSSLFVHLYVNTCIFERNNFVDIGSIISQKLSMGNIETKNTTTQRPQQSPAADHSKKEQIDFRHVGKLLETAHPAQLLESMQIGSCYSQSDDMCTLRPNCSIAARAASPASKMKGSYCVLSISWLSVAMRLLDGFYKSPRHGPHTGLRSFNFVDFLTDILVAALRQRPHVRLGNHTILGDDGLQLAHAPPPTQAVEKMFATLSNQVTVEWVSDLMATKSNNMPTSKKELKDDKLWLQNIDHRNILVMISYLMVRMNCTKQCKDKLRLLMWTPTLCQDILSILASASYEDWIQNIDSLFPLDEKSYTYSWEEAQNTSDLIDVLYTSFVLEWHVAKSLSLQGLNFKSTSFTDLQSA
jgi:hypothetical protein